MQVLTFVPITKQRGIDTLTYFSEANLDIGSVCQIPVRKQHLSGILIKKVDTTDAKPQLRQQSFHLKPLENPVVDFVLPKGFIRAAQQIADFYAGSPGAVLHDWLAKVSHFRNDLETAESPNSLLKKILLQEKTEQYWQTKPAEFVRLVKRELRESPETIYLLVSDKNQQQMAAVLLNEFQPKLITGTSSNKTLDNLQSSSSRLIITSRSYGPLLEAIGKKVIIVNPGGDSWRHKRWPYFHWDAATRAVATAMSRPTTLWSPALDSVSWLSYANSKDRKNCVIHDVYSNSGSPTIIERNSSTKQLVDIVFGNKVIDLIKSNVVARKKTVLYVTRKGLYPVLACQDCKTTTYTKAFKTQMQHYQINSSISDWVDPNTAEEWVDRCHECGSWRLYPVAISVEQVRQALETLVTVNQFLVVDTVSQTHTHTKSVIKKFETEPTIPLLLTTQRGLYNLTKSVDNVIMVSLDAALSASSLSVETEILRLLYHAENLADKPLIIQTRLSNNRVIKTFVTGDIRRYQNTNLDERKLLEFPPFATMIKITLPPHGKVPHEGHLRKLVHELDGAYSQLPGLSKNKILLLTFSTKVWDSDQCDPVKNYLVNISNEYPIRINPDIIM